MRDTLPTPRSHVWIDLDNSPHVPFFAPIIAELGARGHSVVLTARDCFQVPELAERFGLDCTLVGRHYGKRAVFKLAGLGIRAAQLMPTILRVRPRLAVSHCSRAQLLVSACLGIPTVFIGDYEFSTTSALIHPTWYVCPEVIPTEAVRGVRTRVLKYPGIKEDVYVPRFVPSPDLRSRLALPETDVVVTLRPPATEAHYHTPASDELFHAALDFLSAQPHVMLVVVPRTDRQRHDLHARYPSLVRHGTLRLLEHAVDGLDLIWHSDLVISGGGTMNREAAALGVPVYSTFRGRIGAVDRYLSATGRLILLESVDDVHRRIAAVRRQRPSRPPVGGSPALATIVEHITSLVPSPGARPPAVDHPAPAAGPLA